MKFSPQCDWLVLNGTMSVRPTGLVALLVTTALIGAGCGFSLSGPDPQRPHSEMPKCDTGKGAVVLDGVMATVASVVALALVANDESAGALIPAGIAAAYIGGAVHGSRAVDECRAAQDQWASEMAARDTLAHTPPPVDDEPPARKPVQRIEAPVPPVPVAEVPSPPQPPAETQPPPPPQKQVPPPPKQAPPASDDAWSEFWREVQ